MRNQALPYMNTSATRDSAIISRIVDKQRTGLESMSNTHWVLFFRDPENDVYVGYDNADARKCYNDIKRIHPDYKFITVHGFPNRNAAASICQSLRLLSKIIPELRVAETLEN